MNKRIVVLAAAVFVGGFFVANINPALARKVDTNLVVSPVTATYGAAVSLTATLRAGDDLLSGKTINFKIKGSPMGSAMTDTNGVANLTNVDLAGIDASTDNDGVYAKFDGDNDYDPASDEAKLIIAKKTLTVEGVVAEDKTYDRNKSAIVDFSNAVLIGVISGDSVTLDFHDADADFTDWDAGLDKPVTITGLSLDGSDRKNYSVTSPDITADILPKSLTISSGLVPDDKEYDGTIAATLTVGSPALSGVIHDDRITLNSSGATADFEDKNVGEDKSVLISGLILGGADAGNYTFTPPSRTADIHPRSITVAADPQTKKYGESDPIFTYQITVGSLIDGDLLPGALARTPGENVGEYPILQGTLDNPNYGIAYNSTNLTITKAAPTISWSNPLAIVYGTPLDLVNHLNAAVAGISGNFTYNPPAGTILKAGNGQTLSTVFAPDDLTDYLSANKSVTIDVNKRPLNVTVVAEDKVYDATTNATVKLTDDRLIGDDLTVNYSDANFSDPNVGAGKTVIVNGLNLGGSDSDNYQLPTDTITATASILPRALTIAAMNLNKFFGQELIFVGTEFTASGLTGSDEVSSVMLTSPGAGADAPTGDYDIIPSNAGGIGVNNYAITYANGTLTVNEKLNPTIVWSDPAAIVYGTALDANQLNATASYGEIPVDGTFAYAPDFGAVLEAGSNQDLSVTFTPFDAETYNSVSAYAKIEVQKMPIVISADNQTKIYGEIDPDLTYQISGGSLFGSDAISGELSRAGGENVGVYPIESGNLSAGNNYELNFIGATLTINPKTLAITAKDLSKTIGQTLEFDGTEFTVSDDLIEDDTINSVTLFSSGADALAAEGTYPITPSAAVGSGADNYQIVYVDGVLTVNQKLNPVITWENPADILYGVSLSIQYS
jgi:hypothetical protein